MESEDESSDEDRPSEEEEEEELSHPGGTWESLLPIVLSVSETEIISDDIQWKEWFERPEKYLEDGMRDKIRTQKCSQLFRRLRPANQNIMREFADVETFLISMDSLVVEMAAHDFLDWSLGGATAPFVELVVAFLRSLSAKGGMFKLLWFSDLLNLFKANPTLFLLRTVVKKSLEADFCNVEFQNPLDPDYRQFLKKMAPSFLMLTSDETRFDGCEEFGENITSLALLTLLRDSISVVLFAGMGNGLASLSASLLHPIHARSVFRSEIQHVSDSVQMTWRSMRLTGSHLSMYALSSLAQVEMDSTTTAQFTVQVLHELRRSPTEKFDNTFCQLLILYGCLLETLPMDLQVQTTYPPSPDASSLSAQVYKHLPLLRTTIAQLLLQGTAQEFPVLNIYNGPLLMTLALFCEEKLAKQELNLVPDEVMEEFQMTSLEMNIPYEAMWTKAVRKIQNDPASPDDDNAEKSFSKLLPVENPLVNHFAKEVLEKAKEHFVSADFLQPLPPSEELKNWKSGILVCEEIRNSDMLQEPKASSMRKKQRSKQLRNKQKYTDWVKFYGETLEGKDSHLVVDFSFHPAENVIKQTDSPRSSSKKKPKLSKKEEIILQKEKAKKEKEAKEKLTDLLRKNWTIAKLKSFQENPKYSSEELQCQIQFRIFSVAKESFDASWKANKESQKYEDALELTNSIRAFWNRNLHNYLSAEDKLIVESAWKGLGFGSSHGLQKSLPEFLLENGSLIDVQLDPKRDARIKGFVPDLWQRQLLDVVDRNESALIVAPTSVGKTFISYYCMEKVLREGDDGVVVYVAATKALVNQVAATVYARFRNKTYKKQGQYLYGVYIKEYHLNVTNSQILITVPQYLEMLLLNKENDSWSKNIRYVIFDEVHCIGGGLGDVKGLEVWEHVLLMVPSPFLALSATIGNPDTLQKWLSAAEERKRGKTVHLIVQEERYSELEIVLHHLNDTAVQSVLNPLSVFTVEKLETLGFPKDLQLTAAQVLQLFKAISTMEPRLRAKNAPDSVLQSCSLQNWLTRSELRSYENRLKNLLIDEEIDAISPAFRNIVIEKLGEDNKADLAIRTRSKDLTNIAHQQIGELVETLRAKNLLPALCFSEDRNACVSFAAKVYRKLEKEEAVFLSLPGNQEILKRYHKQQELVEKTKAKEQKHRDALTKKQAEHYTFECMERSVEAKRIDSEAFFGAKLQQFYLGKSKTDSDLLDKVIGRLHDKERKNLSLFEKMLRRGIGYHHPAMSTVKRQAVEILFRSGHLGIVFSTSTLALGVHMPCKTVVFGIDDENLTPLQFRQMSGRAGRRGFDAKGFVVILGLPESKICRLLTASLPKLRGNIPFTTSLVGKFLALDDTRKAEILLDNSLLKYSLEEDFEPLCKGNLLFSLAFLRLFGFVNEQGKPHGLFGLTHHLHYHEPGNFMFAYLLSTGLIRKTCSDESSQQTLLLLLCYLFTRKPAILNDKNENDNEKKKREKILPSLPEEYRKALLEYQTRTEFLYNFTRKLAKPQQNKRDPNQKLTELESNLISKAKCQSTESLTNNYLVRQTGPFDEAFLPFRPLEPKNHRGRNIPLNSYAFDFFEHGNLKELVSSNHIPENEVFNLVLEFSNAIEAICVALRQLAIDESDVVLSCFNRLNTQYSEKIRQVTRKRPH